MSLTVIRPYFDRRLKSLGLKEHRDAFNNANISGSNINNSYHVSFGTYQNLSRSNNGQELLVSVRVEFVVTGGLDTIKTHEAALDLSQRILLSIMLISERLNTPGIKNILFENGNLEQLADSNDNIVRGVQNYSVVIYNCY